jgi:hypothetical protein
MKYLYSVGQVWVGGLHPPTHSSSLGLVPQEVMVLPGLVWWEENETNPKICFDILL